MNIKIVAALVALGTLAACASTPSGTEANFGSSTASLVRAQTANPETLTNPSSEPVTGVEPDYAGNVVKALREGVGEPAEVKQPIEIKIGG